MNEGVIQQLGTPDRIYNDPENLFVAGFIGSPAMNLVHGSISDGWFITAGGQRFARTGTADLARVVLGIRAEDLKIHEPDAANMHFPVYAFENTGDSVLLSVQFDQQRLIARGDRHLRKNMDDVIGLSADPEHIYLFDPDTGLRIRPAETEKES